MKYYTKKTCNLIFTIKKDADTTNLIEVKNVRETLKAKNIGWLKQIDDKDFATVLIHDDYTDDRIEKHIDIVPIDEFDTTEEYRDKL